MHKLFIDTNVILDVAMAREPHLKSSQRILGHIENKKAAGFISSTSCATIYYLIQKESNPKQAVFYIRNLLKLVSIAGVDRHTIERGLELGAVDFEDNIQIACAQECQADYIITRNLAHYKNSSILITSPADYLATFNL